MGRHLGPLTDLMLARASDRLPVGRWSYEPKWDGFRCLTVVEEARVQLRSRRHRPLTEQFPEIAAAVLEQVGGRRILLDGELVAYDGSRTDFTALQHRLAGKRVGAVTLVLFDVLAIDAEDLRALPYHQRRALLDELAAGLAAPLAVTPTTEDADLAKTWMVEHAAAGIEGVVAKHLDHGYRPNARAWVKVKQRESTELVVGGVTGTRKRPTALILGRVRDGRLRVVGRTTALNEASQAELTRVFRKPRGTHPWPDRIPSGRFGYLGGEPVEYKRVEPTVVVEVSSDVAFEYGRWRHPARFIRLRTDLRVEDLP